MKKLETTWNLRSYDVWGNTKDGYEVNNSFDAGEIKMLLVIETHNIGTNNEFKSAYPDKNLIRRTCGISALKLILEGDDTSIYVTRERDGYPICELHCTSHKSLSDIKE